MIRMGRTLTPSGPYIGCLQDQRLGIPPTESTCHLPLLSMFCHLTFSLECLDPHMTPRDGWDFVCIVLFCIIILFFYCTVLHCSVAPLTKGGRENLGPLPGE